MLQALHRARSGQRQLLRPLSDSPAIRFGQGRANVREAIPATVAAAGNHLAPPVHNRLPWARAHHPTGVAQLLLFEQRFEFGQSPAPPGSRSVRRPASSPLLVVNQRSGYCAKPIQQPAVGRNRQDCTRFQTRTSAGVTESSRQRCRAASSSSAW
jgi:hypothetical protein